MDGNTNTSQSDLIAFLDYLGDKGLMSSSTAAARKVAVRTLFGVLDAAEAADVTKLDLDEVAVRFLNKRGGQFKPESVRVYKSRVASAIEDLKRYRADPLKFKVTIAPRASGRSERVNAQNAEQPTGTATVASQQPVEAFVSPSELVIPIPIRSNAIVKIVGLPSDLTRAEAAKVANVIQAFATVDDVFE